MVRNYQKKRPVNSRYTEVHLANAVTDVLNKNKTFREAQQAYNVKKNGKMGKNPMTILSAGRRPVLPIDVEASIANCLVARARMCWPADEKELCGLVSDYVNAKGLKIPFKDNIPGNKNATEYKYVCVVKEKDEDDGEIAVTGLRSVDGSCSNFFINEIITSYITIDMVQGILPGPETKFVGRKIIYSFPGRIDIFEKP